MGPRHGRRRRPPRYAIDVKLEVPKDAEPGRAVVVIPTPYMPEPMEVPFEVLGGGPS